jgi:hypothetical protein
MATAGLPLGIGWNLGKARIDPRESAAHLGMNAFERRARSHLFFGLRENIPGSVCLGPAERPTPLRPYQNL